MIGAAEHQQHKGLLLDPWRDRRQSSGARRAFISICQRPTTGRIRASGRRPEGTARASRLLSATLAHEPRSCDDTRRVRPWPRERLSDYSTGSYRLSSGYCCEPARPCGSQKHHQSFARRTSATSRAEKLPEEEALEAG